MALDPFQNMPKDQAAMIQGLMHQDQSVNDTLKSAVQGQVAQGNMSQQDIAARSMAGIGPQAGAIQQAPAQKLAASSQGGGVDEGMLQAISNRTGKLFSSHVNQLQRNAELAAPLTQARQEGEAINAMGGQEQLQNQLYRAQQIRHQNEQAQRNAVINSILKVGGAAVGGYFGGAQGAQSGAQLGSSAGGFLTGGVGQQQDIPT